MQKLEKAEALERLAHYRRGLPEASCVLCAAARAQDADARVVAQNEHGAVWLNRFAQRRGHLMVVAAEHVEHVRQLPWASYAALQRLSWEADAALQRVLSPTRVYSAVLGSGAVLPNSYPHLHIHVIPLHETDERARPARVFSWTEGIFIYDEAEAAALCAELRAAWPER